MGAAKYSIRRPPAPGPVARPVALTIAGSDSGGGAGIEADLKVFALHRVYGCAVLTGLTAQNTRGVQGILPVRPAFVGAQIRSVLTDLPVHAIKTGMLWSRASVLEVVERLTGMRDAGVPIVVDPVMTAKGGDRLLRPDAARAVRERLLPLAALVTPNLPEAEALLGRPVRTARAMAEAARSLVALGASSALVKGGHLRGPARDVLCADGVIVEIVNERRATPHTHGTGCVLSASIAARLARGEPLVAAVRAAIADLQAVLLRSRALGGGRGPADPLLAWGVFGRAARPRRAATRRR